MRRSFGGGIGGGNGGGGLRSVHRALSSGGGAPPEPFSGATNIATPNNSRKSRNQFNKHQTAHPNTALTLSASASDHINRNGSSSFSSLINLPKLNYDDDDDDDDVEWECLDVGEEDGRANVVVYDDFVFGSVPSQDEVKFAVSAIQQAFEPSSFERINKGKHSEDTCKNMENEGDNKTEGFEKKLISSECDQVDWIEPSLTLGNSRMLQQLHGSDRVYDAFHMLQSEPSVQRMVLALSSDKAVWDAVLNNDVVKELRGSISRADEQGGSADEGSDDNNPIKDILSWVFVNAKAKIMQLIDKIAELANEVFQPSNEENGGKIDPLQEKLKTSLFLSVIVLLIVVVTRAKSA